VRQALELVKIAAPGATVWLSNPTWPNHPSIIKYLGMPLSEYRYFDAQTGDVDFDAMLTDIKAIPAGDIVLLHGCCHNPTGANLSEEQEDQIIAALAANGAIPFVDIAYQGFGDGLEGDARFTRKIASQLPECLIAASCSKNFGIYRERTGILMAISPNAALKAVTQGNMAFLNRQNFSFPPDHGARLVTMILADTGLRSTWASELEDTRLSMLNLRQQLADELRQRTNSDRFDFIARHRGMFSLLGVSPEVVETMRADNGVYMVGDSRINIAGLNAHTVPVLAQALAAALK
jgi:aromatic-amino-acid transaminase